MAENYVITISREFGSMGRTIAKKMSEALNIEFYDRDIVEEVSRRMGLPVPTISDAEEKASSYFARMFPLGNTTTDLQDQIFTIQKDIIQNLASKERCIIVGRCADYVLRDYRNHMRVYIYASYEQRYNNCVNNLMMEPKEAARMIKSVDKARKSYHMRYAKYSPKDPKYKDIILDSSFLGIDGTAEYLAELAKKKFQLD
ncbi:MAG: cytidylate kinase-like family protein [Lachnospiraceae bacterium]|nr:cytidylate kinase-like family protein [Lachnospiraceae bacterium]